MDFSSLALPLLLIIFLFGLGLIVKGGDAFVDAASWIAEKSGIPPFIIGATIVSLATTLPELLVSVFATLRGSTDMAVGNAIGSVTANTGLILAISLLAMPCLAPRKTFCAKGTLLLATIATLLFATRSGALSQAGLVLLLLLFALFFAENALAARKATLSATPQSMATQSAAPQSPAKQDTPPLGAPMQGCVLTPTPAPPTQQTNATLRNTLLFLLGAAGIAAGSQILVASATALATCLQIPQAVIAVTIVAVGTALPELVTALTAIAKKESGLSAGNILGANIIDTALILPLCSLLSGSGITISTQSLIYDIPICFACIAIAVLPTLVTQRFQRWQGGAMLFLYLAYLAMVSF